MSYAGNKRNEIKNIYSYLNFENIDTIVEPYAGTSVISFYISSLHPNIKIILNDNNKYLKEIYDIIQDDEKIEQFEKEVNEKKDKIKNKEDYLKAINEKDIFGWFIGDKYYAIHARQCPIGYRDESRMKKPFKLRDYKIFNFYRNPNVSFICDDGINVYEQYKNNDNVMMIMDPPYIAACNCFYIDDSMNIYEHIHNNNIKECKAKIYLILENIWIIKLLFSSNNIIFEYDKKYEISRRKTTHILISNVDK